MSDVQPAIGEKAFDLPHHRRRRRFLPALLLILRDCLLGGMIMNERFNRNDRITVKRNVFGVYGYPPHTFEKVAPISPIVYEIRDRENLPHWVLKGDIEKGDRAGTLI